MFLYITCNGKKQAERISKELLKERLIACSNMIGIKSMYWWKNKIEGSQEVLIIAKTNKKNAARAEAMVKRLHSYKIPCITRIEVKSNKEFENFVDSELR